MSEMWGRTPNPSPEDTAASHGHRLPSGGYRFRLPGTCPQAQLSQLDLPPGPFSQELAGAHTASDLTSSCQRQLVPGGSSHRLQHRGQDLGEDARSKPQPCLSQLPLEIGSPSTEIWVCFALAQPDT